MEHRECYQMWAGEQLLISSGSSDVGKLHFSGLSNRGRMVLKKCAVGMKVPKYSYSDKTGCGTSRGHGRDTLLRPPCCTLGVGTHVSGIDGGGSHEISKLSRLVEGRAGGVCNRNRAPQDLYAVWPVWTHRGVEGCTHWRLTFLRPLTCLPGNQGAGMQSRGRRLKHSSPARPGLVYRAVELCPRQF